MGCRKWEIQILRREEGRLDKESEAAFFKHLKTCARCRDTTDRFAEIDRFLLEQPDPLIPSFLNERIVSRVTEEMREGSYKGAFYHFIASFAYFRPAAAGIILVLGIGVGVLIGLSLSHSIDTSSAGSSYDVLAQAGIEGGGRGASLDFIWTDTVGGGR